MIDLFQSLQFLGLSLSVHQGFLPGGGFMLRRLPLFVQLKQLLFQSRQVILEGKKLGHGDAFALLLRKTLSGVLQLPFDGGYPPPDLPDFRQSVGQLDLRLPHQMFPVFEKLAETELKGHGAPTQSKSFFKD
nr:hypothetical protein [Desulfacinum infernum]